MPSHTARKCCSSSCAKGTRGAKQSPWVSDMASSVTLVVGHHPHFLSLPLPQLHPFTQLECILDVVKPNQSCCIYSAAWGGRRLPHNRPCLHPSNNNRSASSTSMSTRCVRVCGLSLCQSRSCAPSLIWGISDLCVKPLMGWGCALSLLTLSPSPHPLLQSAQLMASNGVHVPEGVPAFTLEDVKVAADKLADEKGEVRVHALCAPAVCLCVCDVSVCVPACDGGCWCSCDVLASPRLMVLACLHQHVQHTPASRDTHAH